jgi:hypothetical protein
LLVLDNFEHVLPAADLVAEILHGAPGVSVLATSREPLGLSHEQVFSLSGLGVPVSGEERSGDASGIQLFVQSARRLILDFTLDDDTFQKAAHVCGLLQGMPLGIVLAASWVNVLSLSEIAREIAANVDFLSSDLRDVPIRHKSIRAVFDYSFHLLRSNERAAMARLSVFHGGFTREGAESVALADLRVLAGLTRKSLLSRDPASGRYELHELLRQYADARRAPTQLPRSARAGRQTRGDAGPGPHRTSATRVAALRKIVDVAPTHQRSLRAGSLGLWLARISRLTAVSIRASASASDAHVAPDVVSTETRRACVVRQSHYP